MLTALSASKLPAVANSSTATERDADRNDEATCGGAAEGSEQEGDGGWGGDGGSGGARGGGEVPDDVGMFVEELRVRRGGTRGICRARVRGSVRCGTSPPRLVRLAKRNTSRRFSLLFSATYASIVR